jgi:hypothetical protein
MYRVLLVDGASSIMRFRIVRHLYVTADNHREYHSRTAPPFKLKGVPCMRNVTTCADPLSSAVIRSVQVCNTVDSHNATILTCSVYTSPIPPAGVYVQSISTDSSQSIPSACDSQRKHPRTAPHVIHDEEGTQDEGTQSSPDSRRQGHGSGYGHRRHNNDNEYPGRHRKPVRFHQPQCASSISKLSIELVNAALVDSNHAAGAIPKAPSFPVNATDRTWRDTFAGKHSHINCFEVEDCGAHYVLSVFTDTPSVRHSLSGDDASEWRS